MVDMGEDFRVWNEQKKQKRESNRQHSAQMLTDAGFVFESKNGGAHLIVKHHNAVADFWPGTGKWNIRGNKIYRRGVRSLMKELLKVKS